EQEEGRDPGEWRKIGLPCTRCAPPATHQLLEDLLTVADQVGRGVAFGHGANLCVRQVPGGVVAGDRLADGVAVLADGELRGGRPRSEVKVDQEASRPA